MIYKFRIVSDEADNFKLEILIDSDDTFLRLRNAILDAVGYTKDHFDSFVTCDDDWSKDKEITLADMGTDPDQDIWIMEDTPLSELIDEEGQKLIYIFDYMTERCFFMEMNEIITGRTLLDPLCQLKEGKAPKQFVEIDEARPAPITTSIDDIDEDFYGSDSYNDEELADLADFDDEMLVE